MDRRLFLTGMLGIAVAATLAVVAKPNIAEAGIPSAKGGILGELDGPADEFLEDQSQADSQPEVEQVQYWRYRRRRRRVWRRVCRRYRRHHRWVTRCYRRVVWVWY
jgi:hypothetical protein